MSDWMACPEAFTEEFEELQALWALVAEMDAAEAASTDRAEG